MLSLGGMFIGLFASRIGEKERFHVNMKFVGLSFDVWIVLRPNDLFWRWFWQLRVDLSQQQLGWIIHKDGVYSWCVIGTD